MKNSRCRAAVLVAAAGWVGCFGGSSGPPAPAESMDGGATDGSALDMSAADAGASDGSTDSGADGVASEASVDGGCLGGGGSGTFTCTGSLATARIAPGGAVLTNGAALVAGGWNFTDKTLTSAELFDPATGTFAPTGGMADAHLWAGWTASWPVLSSGQVLVGGGLAASGALLSSAELYDPVAGTFSTTGPLTTAVIAFDLVTLQDHSVLFIGGYSSVTGTPPTPGWSYTAGTNQVQSYSPAAGTFASVGPVAEQRLFGCNVVLSTGKVLAIGGWVGQAATAESNIEQYDPGTAQWTTVGTLGAGVTCSEAAFMLPNGQVLLDGANLLDPVALTTTPVAGAPSASSLMLAQLASGDVLAAGGLDSMGHATAQAQIYRAVTGQWTGVGSLHQPRSGGRALALPSGDVLIVGGGGATGAALAGAELYHP